MTEIMASIPGIDCFLGSFCGSALAIWVALAIANWVNSDDD